MVAGIRVRSLQILCRRLLKKSHGSGQPCSPHQTSLHTRHCIFLHSCGPVDIQQHFIANATFRCGFAWSVTAHAAYLDRCGWKLRIQFASCGRERRNHLPSFVLGLRGLVELAAVLRVDSAHLCSTQPGSVQSGSPGIVVIVSGTTQHTSQRPIIATIAGRPRLPPAGYLSATTITSALGSFSVITAKADCATTALGCEIMIYL